jgi:hypothetical protein
MRHRAIQSGVPLRNGIVPDTDTVTDTSYSNRRARGIQAQKAGEREEREAGCVAHSGKWYSRYCTNNTGNILALSVPCNGPYVVA